MNSNTLFTEMFDGVEVNAPLLPTIHDIEMEGLMSKVDGMKPGPADKVVKQIFKHDLLEQILGKDIADVAVPVSLESSLPVAPPKKVSTHRKKIAELIASCGITANEYTRQAIESLITSVETYVTNAIGEVGAM
jgi:hypothetical protein